MTTGKMSGGPLGPATTPKVTKAKGVNVSKNQNPQPGAKPTGGGRRRGGRSTSY